MKNVRLSPIALVRPRTARVGRMPVKRVRDSIVAYQ
jgi:hypothetical protein